MRCYVISKVPTSLLHPSCSSCLWMRLWLSDDSIATLLLRRWTHGRCIIIDRLSTTLRCISPFRLLQLDPLLLASEITLVVVPLIYGRRIHGWCLVVVGKVWLRGSTCILSWCVACRCGSCGPACTTVG